jgi:cysteine desulfurase
MKRIYFDNAATTRVDPRVLAKMRAFFSEKYGNPNSLHSFGREAREAVEAARESAAKVINAKPNEVIFTGSGTEANNLAIKGIAFAKKKGHVIVSAIEHHCVLEAAEWLKSQGFDVSVLGVDKDGLVNLDELEKSIRPDTILVSIMTANNEIGTIEPIREISKICHDHGVLFHTDAVQAYGKIPIDVKRDGIDLLSASGHKIYGPKGVGLLYIREGIEITPLLHGGGQEFGIRSSTENVPGIVGFGAAAEICRKTMVQEAARLKKMRDVLIKALSKIPHSRLNGHPEKRLPNNVNFSFEFIEGEALVSSLDAEGIAVSTGSACSSRSLKPSHVLLAIGLPPHIAHGSMRLTLGRFNTASEVRYAQKVITRVIENLRKISPYKGKW